MNPLGLVLLFVSALAGLAAEPIRIALVSDPHTTRGGKEDQALYRGRFDRVIADVNAAKADFVLVAGDLTQDGRPEELEDFRQQARGFQAPTYWVPGNHDVGAKRIPGKPGGPTVARLDLFEHALGPSFWVRDSNGMRVIGLNSQLFGSGLPREDEMWALIENETTAPAPAAVVVVMHMPPFVRSADEAGDDYWNIEPGPRARLLALLKRGGIRTVLTGHLHRQLINRHDGILLVTTAPVSFGLPRGVAPQGWTLITLPRIGADEAHAEFHLVRD